jgi:hypothetical protein
MRDQPVPEAETIDYWTRLEETRITEKKINEKLRISDPDQRKDQMESEPACCRTFKSFSAVND